MKNQTSENLRQFIRRAWKFVHEWNDHLEIFSRPQVTENSWPIFGSLNRYFTENSPWVPLKITVKPGQAFPSLTN